MSYPELWLGRVRHRPGQKGYHSGQWPGFGKKKFLRKIRLVSCKRRSHSVQSSGGVEQDKPGSEKDQHWLAAARLLWLPCIQLEGPSRLHTAHAVRRGAVEAESTLSSFHSFITNVAGTTARPSESVITGRPATAFKNLFRNESLLAYCYSRLRGHPPLPRGSSGTRAQDIGRLSLPPESELATFPNPHRPQTPPPPPYLSRFLCAFNCPRKATTPARSAGWTVVAAHQDSVRGPLSLSKLPVSRPQRRK